MLPCLFVLLLLLSTRDGKGNRRICAGDRQADWKHLIRFRFEIEPMSRTHFWRDV